MIAIPNPVRILMDDNPLLRTVSQPVLLEHFGGELTALVEIMVNVATPRLARGLAAVQIGVPVCVLIVADEVGRYESFVNPQVLRTLNRSVLQREGCLSIHPRNWGDVSRPAKCDVKWLDVNGGEHSETLRGDRARVFQHEFDHLKGVLMTDYRLAA